MSIDAQDTCLFASSSFQQECSLVRVIAAFLVRLLYLQLPERISYSFVMVQSLLSAPQIWLTAVHLRGSKLHEYHWFDIEQSLQHFIV
jgi:hypothetical protein